MAGTDSLNPGMPEYTEGATTKGFVHDDLLQAGTKPFGLKIEIGDVPCNVQGIKGCCCNYI